MEVYIPGKHGMNRVMPEKCVRDGRTLIADNGQTLREPGVFFSIQQQRAIYFRFGPEARSLLQPKELIQ